MPKRGRLRDVAGGGGGGGGGSSGSGGISKKRKTEGAGINWDCLPWHSVDVSNEDLGNFTESVFFGLEELDGNAYAMQMSTSASAVANDEGELTRKESKKEQRKKARELIANNNVDIDAVQESNADSSNSNSKNNEKKAKQVPEKKQTTEQTNEQKEKQNQKKQKEKLRKEKLKKEKLKTTSSAIVSVAAAVVVPDGDADWGGIKLHTLLQQALITLNFTSPTPIQRAAIPVVTTGKQDLVGAAETGSGKTLAFALPVVDFLLRNWDAYSCRISPVALIIAPTRELAMQISTVIKELCGPFRELRKVEVVSVVGGMSEQKQRRQLCGGVNPENGISVGKGFRKPVHVLVATPGRLCELIQDDSIPMFADMSGIRFLIVDEADRILEEGHFPELHRMFSRIRGHEKLHDEGQDPQELARIAKEGTYEKAYPHSISKRVKTKEAAREEQQQIEKGDDGEEEEEEEEDDNDDDNVVEKTGPSPNFDEEAAKEELDAWNAEMGIVFEPMPTEEQMAEARRTTPAVPYDSDENDDEAKEADDEDEDGKMVVAKSTTQSDRPGGEKYATKQRQTLLFSATALRSDINNTAIGSQGKKNKKWLDKVKVKGIGSGAVKQLPLHLQQLLALVGLQGQTQVVDVTGGAPISALKVGTTGSKGDASKKGVSSSSKGSNNDDDEEEEEEAWDGHEVGAPSVLPKGLSQCEYRVPAEDKDMMAYYYLVKHPGRCLLFVNSIKSARRIDALLRALGVNCRTIHAQLQQRQRLRALDAFRSAPVGVLVATDVAARGLDIPKVQAVIHYDVARSPQLYIHRSGRTARANATGTAISLIAPEDSLHHTAICEALAAAGDKAIIRGTIPTSTTTTTNSAAAGKGKGKGKGKEIPPPVASTNSDKNGPKLPLLAVDLSIVPALRTRVALAKKIFTQSFVVSKRTKEQSWLRQSANEADLEMDDFAKEEYEDDEQRQELDSKAKKAVEKLRHELKLLLDQPLTQKQGAGMIGRKNAFVVVAK